MTEWNDLSSQWNDTSAEWDDTGSGPVVVERAFGGSLSPAGTLTGEFIGQVELALGGSLSPTGAAAREFTGQYELLLGGSLTSSGSIFTGVTGPAGEFTVPQPSTTGVNVIPIGIGSVSNAQDAFFGATGRAYRRVDIYNADGTVWMQDAPVIEGQVTVDMNRDERRMADITFDNEGFAFRSDPGNFWYDKIIKIFRGVQDDDDSTLVYQMGEFMIDRISCPHFPLVAKVTCRDYTKKLKKAKFSEATAFALGAPLEQVITGILVAAGVTRYNIPNTGIALDREFYFESGTERWEAIKQLATAFGYEVFFDQVGTFEMRLFVDPTTAPIQFTFFTGEAGNLARYELSTHDTRISNHIVVTGTASDILPVYGIAENTQPGSPTSIDEIGRRTYPYDSKFIATQAQAQSLAEQFLKIMALESYELELDALVAPWLEAGVAVQFVDPNPAPEAPNRFLLTNFEVPLAVGTMSCGAKRVTIVT